jgi:hypothetical protein
MFMVTPVVKFTLRFPVEGAVVEVVLVPETAVVGVADVGATEAGAPTKT